MYNIETESTQETSVRQEGWLTSRREKLNRDTVKEKINYGSTRPRRVSSRTATAESNDKYGGILEFRHHHE